ncbi:MAG: sulfatase-like hydrolase/transferase [Candidatus Binataceae bacterium]
MAGGELAKPYETDFMKAVNLSKRLLMVFGNGGRELLAAACLIVLLLVSACGGGGGGGSGSTAPANTPNIVMILMDDIGIDQWTLFGYGGQTPPALPTIGTIAQGGVRFHNLWSMPACSNGRAAVFTGRYPFRTHVLTALGENDLANYMVNPNEFTMPLLLHQRGYKSALFGKFHIGVQSHDPYGLGMVHALGFDYFDGWLDETGDPSSIDSTAGGVAPLGTWSCGFVRDAAHGGADSGACYAGNNTCQVVSKSGAEAPGRVCRDAGGIFDPNQPCQSPVPSYINFGMLSGHYVSPLDINEQDGTVQEIPSTDLRARTFRGIEPVDAAVAWIKSQPAKQPWMVTLSFATVHTPVIQPPSQLLPASDPDSSNLDCADPNDQRVISNDMEEALDFEVGQFLVEIGLATQAADGSLTYNPRASNTYLIFVTDNGTNGSEVKLPFDPIRAKSTAYQTGVWVPGIVSGPGVVQPGREVNAMVNIVDIFELVGELAGINVHKAVPQTIDSAPMLPYLKNPRQTSIRQTNYTEIGTNLQANGVINSPCQFNTTTCTQIAPTKGVCEDNNAIWWGAGATDPSTAGIPPQGLQYCCNVAIWQHDHGQTISTDIYPLQAYGIRNDQYKVVVNNYQGYDAATNSCAPTTSTEFYQINEDVPIPKLDRAGSDLLASGVPLTPVQQKNFDALSAALNALLASEPACPWDINLDGVVNDEDIAEWSMLVSLSMGNSSWADINQDGLTNQTDEDLIEQHFGPCPK